MGHYKLPYGNVQISFSGGRTSAYMLHQILEANGGIPDRCEVVFANTGREMPQTLDFVAEVGQRFGVRITWVEYAPHHDPRQRFRIVCHNGAARDGEPFEAMINGKHYLPNQQTRFCTSELKVRPAKEYLISLGWESWVAAVGIRADEQRRINREPLKERWQRWYPLADAGVSKHDVSAFWARQPFDLRLPNIRGNTSLGNCDGCFLKSEAVLAALCRDMPDRHAWWERMEMKVSEWTLGSGATFSKRFSRREMRLFIEKQGDWIFEMDGALCQADGGECI